MFQLLIDNYNQCFTLPVHNLGRLFKIMALYIKKGTFPGTEKRPFVL